MAPCRNTRPSPRVRVPSADSQQSDHPTIRRPRTRHTSEEDFDLDVPDGDKSEQEDDGPPVRSTGGTANTTQTQTQINDPSAFGMTTKPQTEYEFFFSPKVKHSTEKRLCLHCT
jgi:hypothetical protein